MKKTVLICDRCGKEVRKLINEYVPYYYNIHGVVSHAFEICPLCAEELVEISKTFYSDRMLKEVGIK